MRHQYRARFVFTACIFLAAMGSPAFAELQYVVNFDKAVSLGTLRAWDRPSGTPFATHNFDGEHGPNEIDLGPAKGEIGIPLNRWVALDVNGPAPLRPSASLRVSQTKIDGVYVQTELDPWVDVIARLSGVSVVALDASKTSPGALRRLSALTSLEGVSLYCNKSVPREKILELLGALSELRQIHKVRFSLRGAFDGPAGEALARSTHLDELSLGLLTEDTTGVRALRALTAVKSLSIFSFYPLANESLAAIGDMGQLERVSISHNPLPPNGLAELHRLRALEALEIDCRIDDATAIEIGTLPSLKHLGLYVQFQDTQPGIGDAGFAGLTSLKGLETLHITHCGKLTPSIMASLASFENLHDFSLLNYSEYGQNWGELATLSCLKRLSIRGEIMDNAHLMTLAQVSGLEEITILMGNKITEDGIRNLHVNLPGLQKLTIGGRMTSFEESLK